MGTGYTRNDTSNNIANGNVIDADDLDGEFNAVESAFNESTGHTHDGTSAEGAPIEVTGPNQEYVSDATALYPKTDDTYDLGKTGAEWKDLYVDGTANIDSLVADTADINGGTIDGVTLGTNSAVTEAQVDNINIDGNAITSTDTNGNIALTPDGTGEVDISKVDIDSGTIDGTVIGGSTPAAISGTTGQFDTSLNVDGTITSDGLTVDSNQINQNFTGLGGRINFNFNGGQTSIAADGTYAQGVSVKLDRNDLSNFGYFEVVDGSTEKNLFLVTDDGDISFYEDTGTTPKFFWDASAESLGIGTSSPQNNLDVVGSTGIYQRHSSGGRLVFDDSDTADASTPMSYITNTAGSLQFGRANRNASTGLTTSSVESMRIDSSGRVGIGTSSPAGYLHIAGGDPFNLPFRIENTSGSNSFDIKVGTGATVLETNGGQALTINTNSSEAMRIDSSGNLLVGTTTAPNTLAGASATQGLASNGSQGYLVAAASAQPTAYFNRQTSDGDSVIFRKDGSTVGSISVTGLATSYNTSSDERLKENITDAQDASAVIDGIQVRQFDWRADGEHQRYGMIAQELYAVAPEAVTKGDTEDDMWSVDYSKLVPMLVKEIQDLRKRVAELEGA